MFKKEGNARVQLGEKRVMSFFLPKVFRDHWLLPPDLRRQVKNLWSGQGGLPGNRLKKENRKHAPGEVAGSKMGGSSGKVVSWGDHTRLDFTCSSEAVFLMTCYERNTCSFQKVKEEEIHSMSAGCIWSLKKTPIKPREPWEAALYGAERADPGPRDWRWESWLWSSTFLSYFLVHKRK